jgi:predicted outer membrane repeat protein/parallel beta-helix repeat protein
MAAKTFLKTAPAILFFLTISAVTIQAETIYVDDDNPADFNNIQAAIDNAVHGDIIIVNPGTYTGGGNRDIDYNGKAVTVRSIDPNDPDIVAATIIDSNGTKEDPHRGFYFHNDEDANSVLAGLTITNGYAFTGGGICCEASRPTITNCIISGNKYGGLYFGLICYLTEPHEPPPPPPPPPAIVEERSTPEALSDFNLPGPTITNCTFSENSGSGISIGDSNATMINCIFNENSPGVSIFQSNVVLASCVFNGNSSYEGGGIRSRNGNMVLIDCTFSQNQSRENGGGIYNSESNAELIDCIFSGNSAYFSGGGISNESVSNLMLNNCTFTGNSAGIGGGIHSRDSSLTLADCTFNGNSTDYEGGGGIYAECCKPKITNCTFSYNTASPMGGGIYLYKCPSPPPPPPPPPDPPFPFSLLAEQSSWETASDTNLPGPVITNCIFTGNSAWSGGGLVIGEPNSIVSNCIFTANSANYWGGGMLNSAVNTSLIDCVFSDNSAQSGGAMFNIGHFTSITRCVFSNNSATYRGGGMYNDLVLDAVLTNCAFIGNRAMVNGGGIYNEESTTWLRSSTYSQNWAGSEGGGIWWEQLHPSSPYPPEPPPPPPPLPSLSSLPADNVDDNAVTYDMEISDSDINYIIYPMITNCIFWKNSDSTGENMSAQICVDPEETPLRISYSCIQGLLVSLYPLGNINADPAFVAPGCWVDPNDPNIIMEPNDPNAVWVDGDYHLLPVSPCIDAGDNASVVLTTDLDGSERIVNGIVDMGAYEHQGPRQTSRFYVDGDAVGANNGSSWENAFKFLYDALNAAWRGDEILVAQGIYKPDWQNEFLENGREAAFRLKSGVAVRGGYAGIGAPNPNERSIRNYKCVLSGDLFGNDRQVSEADELLSDPCRADNSYHVVIGSGTDDKSILDGFTINAGNDNRFYFIPWPGSGIILLGQGGGMFNFRGNPVVTNCTFIKNSANLEGGGLYNSHGCITLASCMFVKNFSVSGGAVCNCPESVIKLLNCTFVGNVAENGSGWFDWQEYEPGLGDVQISNSISSSISNSILWDGGDEIYSNLSSAITITYSDVWGGWPGQGNINADPSFVDKANEDYRLLPISPCIDTGDPNYIPEPNETDLDGNPRIINNRIDIGAYEYGAAISAEVDFDPNTLNLASKGKWITAFIWLPEDYNAADIDPNSVVLENEIKPDRFWLAEDNQIAIAKFDRKQVQAILDIGEVELTITGRLIDGTLFQASDKIKVIDKSGKE